MRRGALRTSLIGHLAGLIVYSGIGATSSVGQPVVNDPTLRLDLVAEIPGAGIRLDYLESTGLLYMVERNGRISTIDPETGARAVVSGREDHGLSAPQGFAISNDGRFFLSGNVRIDSVTTGLLVRGTLRPGEVFPSDWETVATTESYALSKDFNHLWTAIRVHPRGRYVYLASGSRTDHGEVQDNDGAHPNLREEPITSSILRLPADTTDLVLLNDEDYLTQNGFLYADGVRNHFDLAFDGNRLLFGVENSGDRDDEDELNWIRRGYHYGFPWRMGTHDTPQQFADYDPDSDLLINAASAAAQLDLFVDDPSYPAAPEGVVFADPIPNLGPHLSKFRDPSTGFVADASSTPDVQMGTFTPHTTPLGLAFDRHGNLAEPYTRGGFTLAWIGHDSPLFAPFDDVGESLFHLALIYDSDENTFQVETSRILEGMEMPLDAVLVDTTLFIMEMRFGPPANLWALRFPRRTRRDPLVSDPEVLVDDLSVERIATVPFNVIRIAYDVASDALIYLTQNGTLFRLNRQSGRAVQIADAGDHGISGARGLEVGSDGMIYVLGNESSGSMTSAIVRRASLAEDPTTWQTVMTTEAYPRSGTDFDHLMNGLIVSADNQSLFITSGSRTDHGEVQENGGAFENLREVPLTSMMLRVPADANDLVVPADAEALDSTGWVFARGFRNAFDLAWDRDGRLFGTENSGDRDDVEELNWIREGRHYGFPWVIGESETPQQFPNYDVSEDPFVGPYASDVFKTDPEYPPPPPGLTFEEPVSNVGPDADHFRDPDTGVLLDASELGLTLGTFTPHRSPLGLVFDTSLALAEPYAGHGFVLSWTGGANQLLAAHDDEGQDLLDLAFSFEPADSSYTQSATRLVAGFRRPIDAVLVGSDLYVMEMDFSPSATPGIYRVRFPGHSTAGEENILEVPERARITFYPNPVSKSGMMRLTIPEAGLVRVSLYDIQGRVVARLMDRFLREGSHEIGFSLSTLTPGLYFARIETGVSSAFHPIIRVD